MGSSSFFHISPEHQPLLRRLGLDADTIFDHPDVRVWRSIPERENALLDATLPEGSPVRWHIKRFRAARDCPAQREAEGIRLLTERGIPTVRLIGWGRRIDGRSFLITEDLAGYRPADRLLEEGLPFERILTASAELAAALHTAELHHRDLYLCHFFARVEADTVELRLIDAGRVRRLPRWPLRQRWIIKDLAQFWYSTLPLAISDEQRARWLRHYAHRRGLGDANSFENPILRKARWIARHDQRLRRAQPQRNVSIPQ